MVTFYLLVFHCWLCSRASLCSLTHSQARGKMSDQMSLHQAVLNHSALRPLQRNPHELMVTNDVTPRMDLSWPAMLFRRLLFTERESSFSRVYVRAYLSPCLFASVRGHAWAFTCMCMRGRFLEYWPIKLDISVFSLPSSSHVQSNCIVTESLSPLCDLSTTSIFTVTANV